MKYLNTKPCFKPLLMVRYIIFDCCSLVVAELQAVRAAANLFSDISMIDADY